ncbi:MAG TPA: hypothetical protein VKJ07_24665, partial [Mycobacteriales bacterium]|nr:hypothetical protein [Mycobacteriales bacterium]
MDRPGAALPRRLGIVLALIPVLAVGLADAVIAVRTANPEHSTSAARSHVSVHGRPADRSDARRIAALHDLLERRSAAVLHHDRAGFLATVDPGQPKFVAEQTREYAAISVVPLASWSYDMNASQPEVSVPRLARYGAPTWAPAHFTLDYAIRGFDTSPTTLRQFPTFVQRAQQWYVASFSDFASSSQRSDVDIWNFGAVRTARAPGVLVLGHPASLDLMRGIADEAAAAIPRVSAVWGKDWPRRVVVLVPSSQHELAQIIDDSGDLSQIAAVASAEVQDCPGPPNPVGYRVAINPRNWGKLSSLGRRVVLTHELTHVATRAVTGSCTPTWLVEGFADYVGYLNTGVPTTVVAQELAADVRAGRLPTHLPVDADFNGDNKRLA